MTLGRCPLGILYSRGSPPKALLSPPSDTAPPSQSGLCSHVSARAVSRSRMAQVKAQVKARLYVCRFRSIAELQAIEIAASLHRQRTPKHDRNVQRSLNPVSCLRLLVCLSHVRDSWIETPLSAIFFRGVRNLAEMCPQKKFRIKGWDSSHGRSKEAPNLTFDELCPMKDCHLQGWVPSERGARGPCSNDQIVFFRSWI